MKQNRLVLACCMSLMCAPIHAADGKTLVVAGAAGAAGAGLYGWWTGSGSNKGGSGNKVQAEGAVIDQGACDELAALKELVIGDQNLEGNSILVRLQALEQGDAVDKQARNDLAALDLAGCGFDGKNCTLGKVVTNVLNRLEVLDNNKILDEKGVVQGNSTRIAALEEKINNLGQGSPYVSKAELKAMCKKTYEEMVHNAVAEVHQAGDSGVVGKISEHWTGDPFPADALSDKQRISPVEALRKEFKTEKTNLEAMIAALLQRIEALEKGKEKAEEGE